MSNIMRRKIGALVLMFALVAGMAWSSTQNTGSPLTQGASAVESEDLTSPAASTDDWELVSSKSQTFVIKVDSAKRKGCKVKRRGTIPISWNNALVGSKAGKDYASLSLVTGGCGGLRVKAPRFAYNMAGKRQRCSGALPHMQRARGKLTLREPNNRTRSVTFSLPCHKDTAAAQVKKSFSAFFYPQKWCPMMVQCLVTVRATFTAWMERHRWPDHRKKTKRFGIS